MAKISQKISLSQKKRKIFPTITASSHALSLLWLVSWKGEPHDSQQTSCIAWKIQRGTANSLSLKNSKERCQRLQPPMDIDRGHWWQKGDPETENHLSMCPWNETTDLVLWNLKNAMFPYVNCELPDVQAGFRQRKERSNCQHLMDHRKSKRVPEKHLFLLYWLCQSLWLCGSQ